MPASFVPLIGIESDDTPNWRKRTMTPKALLRRLTAGALKNVAFRDMRRLVEAFGFRLARVSGSHHVYVHPHLSELLNLQEVRGEAKPYQIRQFVRLVERYDLRLDERE